MTPLTLLLILLVVVFAGEGNAIIAACLAAGATIAHFVDHALSADSRKDE